MLQGTRKFSTRRLAARFLGMDVKIILYLKALWMGECRQELCSIQVQFIKASLRDWSVYVLDHPKGDES